jgi:hypothetical protein
MLLHFLQTDYHHHQITNTIITAPPTISTFSKSLPPHNNNHPHIIAPPPSKPNLPTTAININRQKEKPNSKKENQNPRVE